MISLNENEQNVTEIIQKLTEKSKLNFKKYQIYGIKWSIIKEKIGGAIIADEMGLGKTLQIISVIVANFKRRTLIVLPPILIDQWVQAFKTITGHTPFVYHSKFNKIKDISETKLKTYPIVITSYGMISENPKKINILHAINWNRVVYDEAHHLRNKNTSTFKGASILKTSINWFITGTPIQNKINDLYSICQLLGIPKKFYNKTENHQFIRDNFILKRTKKEVDIHLPLVKMNHVLIPSHNIYQQALDDEIHSILPYYAEHKHAIMNGEEQIQEEDNELEHSINKIVIKPSGKIINFTDPKNILPTGKLFSSLYENNVLPAFIRARQLSIYPPMIKKVISDNTDIVTDYNDTFMYKKASEDTTKIDTMIKFIEERKYNQNKKIIFCFFKQEIDYILCQLNIINVTAKVIDGRTSTTNKKKIIAGVPDILILQIQTSCEGLNLQDYSEIYFTSPHWNPAVESQAIARAHRIGQNKDVHVFKFIHINFVKSIEQHILSVQKHKHDIAKKIL